MSFDITKINNTFLCKEILKKGNLKGLTSQYKDSYEIVKRIEAFENKYWHQYNSILHIVRTFTALYESDPNIDVHEEMINDELDDNIMKYIVAHLAKKDIEEMIKYDLVEYFGEKDGSYNS